MTGAVATEDGDGVGTLHGQIIVGVGTVETREEHAVGGTDAEVDGLGVVPTVGTVVEGRGQTTAGTEDGHVVERVAINAVQLDGDGLGGGGKKLVGW